MKKGWTSVLLSCIAATLVLEAFFIVVLPIGLGVTLGIGIPAFIDITSELSYAIYRPSVESHSVDDYSTAYNFGKNRLGYGTDSLHSYLALMPKDAPSTIKEFYCGAKKRLADDGYALYYACTLEEESFESFVDGLENFTVKAPSGEQRHLLKDTESFKYTAYIIQWIHSPEKYYSLYEYFLVDEETKTVMFVYTSGMRHQIELNSSYNLDPRYKLISELENYSIYADNEYNLSGSDDFQYSEYDASFLKYLNNSEVAL